MVANTAFELTVRLKGGNACCYVLISVKVLGLLLLFVGEALVFLFGEATS